jgi:hypothetical protein
MYCSVFKVEHYNTGISSIVQCYNTGIIKVTSQNITKTTLKTEQYMVSTNVIMLTPQT